MLYLSTTARTTELFTSFGIEVARKYIKKMKLSFYLRLRTNEYTSMVLTNLSKLDVNNDYLSEIRKYLGVHKNTSLESLDHQAPQSISDIRREVVERERESELVNELKTTYGISNPRERTEKLRKLLSSFEAA
jgi:hypothetical protein